MKIFTNIKLFLLCTLILGTIYPVLIYVLGNLFYQNEIKGSLVYKNNEVIGSALIAQKFTTNKYFHPRPSAVDYNALGSGASNLSPISKRLFDEVQKRKEEGHSGEMLFTSGSGLDPHISEETALKQMNRVAEARLLNPEQVKKLHFLVMNQLENEESNLFEKRKVNVLMLNSLLDEEFK